MKWTEEVNRRGSEIWNARVGTFRLAVLQGHICYPGQWILQCYLNIADIKSLTARTADEAKAEATAIVRGILQEALAELEEQS